MFLKMVPSHLYSVLLFLLLTVVVKSDRKITAELNPGCKISECQNIILVHVKAEGKNDTLHHLWDFTGKPSLLLALTEKNATVSIYWSTLSLEKEGAIKIDPPPKYVYGLVVDKLIEFDDEKGNGELDGNANSSHVLMMDTVNFNWTVFNLTNTSGDATLIVEAYPNLSKRSDAKNGIIHIEVSAYGGEEHAESLPHLLHSGNASQLDLTLDGLTTHFKQSRFGLQLITASSDPPQSNDTHAVQINLRKTLDDEHAPGIFTIVEMMTPSAKVGSGGGYAQWRPVVYTSPSRDMTSSTGSVQYQVTTCADPKATLNHTLIYYTLASTLPSMLVTATNVTFGTADDGYYIKKKYATWTMVVGYGHPPEEQFSALVILVLLIGLGIPALLILTGTVCIILRRLQRNKDDLFLSR